MDDGTLHHASASAASVFALGRTPARSAVRKAVAPAVLALVVVLACAAALETRQPLGEPWWFFADSDCSR